MKCFCDSRACRSLDGYFGLVTEKQPIIDVGYGAGVFVSCALYTQTILLGGGRIETLMTELMVTVGSERRSAALGLIESAIALDRICACDVSQPNCVATS